MEHVPVHLVGYDFVRYLQDWSKANSPHARNKVWRINGAGKLITVTLEWDVWGYRRTVQRTSTSVEEATVTAIAAAESHIKGAKDAASRNKSVRRQEDGGAESAEGECD